MCALADAARERRAAAEHLRASCEGDGLSGALRHAFIPIPLDEGWHDVLGKLRAAGGKS